MRIAAATLATILVLFLAGPSGYAQSGPPGPPTLPSGFATENAAGTDLFFLPVDLAFASDGRLFVAEKEGVVWIVKDGRKLATPFLDLQDEVLESGDRGMTSIALDPDFATNGYVYLYYTVNPSGGEDLDRLDSFARITRFTAVGDEADPASRHVVLDRVPACYFSHANDTMLFAPDGSLIVSAGDAASYQQMDAGGLYDECFGAGGPLQPFENIGAFRAQQLESLAGKILRIDPANGQGYASNPFYTGDARDTRSKVWAYGLRNPFSFTLRPGTGSALPSSGQPGSLFIGDVGWTMWEELNVSSTGGENFGWPCYEGPFEQPQYQDATPAMHGCGTVGGSGVTQAQLYWTDDPAASVPAGLRGDAIIVGDFYQGVRYPTAYQGALFYADYPNGWMATGRFDDVDQFEAQALFSTDTGAVVAFAYDPTSQWMHYLNIVTGEVLRIVYDGPLENPVPLPWQSADIGDPDAEGTATYDAYADVLTLDGGGALGPYDTDAFHFVSRDLDGDFVMEARLDTLAGGADYARAGIMARASTAANAPYLHLAVTKLDGLYFEWRLLDGTYGYAHLAEVPVVSAPTWLRLTRTGDTYTAATSSDGATWTERGTQAVPMSRRVLAGFVVTADDPAGSLAQAVFSNLGVEGGVDPDGLPVPWRSAQVGPGQGGEEAIFNGSAFSITGAGDVWGDADDFHWAYQAIEGNVSIRARLTRIAAPYDWSKAGLMVRESLARGSAHAFLVATPTRGTHLQTRDSTQAMMASHALTDDDPAVWLRLDRIGHVFTAYVSDDGQTWTPHGSFPVSMGPGVLVGLASTATDLDGAGVVSIGTFADVTVEPITGGRQPPPIAAFDTPAPFQLRGVYPNPFNPTTTVAFQVDESGFYAVEVFNLLGQRVYSDRFREESSTTREVRVDLSGHASGTYIVRVLHEATGYSVREKVVLLK